MVYLRGSVFALFGRRSDDRCVALRGGYSDAPLRALAARLPPSSFARVWLWTSPACALFGKADGARKWFGSHLQGCWLGATKRVLWSHRRPPSPHRSTHPPNQRGREAQTPEYLRGAFSLFRFRRQSHYPEGCYLTCRVPPRVDLDGNVFLRTWRASVRVRSRLVAPNSPPASTYHLQAAPLIPRWLSTP